MNYIELIGNSSIRTRFENVMIGAGGVWGCTLKAVHADRLNFYLHDLHLGGDRLGSRA